VQLEPGGEPAVIVANRRDEDFSPWFAYRLDPGGGFAAAVAVDERDLRISAWDWPAGS
jgi:hypothetical protein